MSMNAHAYLGAYLWCPNEAPDCYPRLTEVNDGCLIPNVSYEGKPKHRSTECRFHTEDQSEIEIGPLDRDTERALFGRAFEAEIDTVMKAEPHAEIRWGLLLWHM